MANDTEIYESYHAMVSEISSSLNMAGKVCSELQMKETEEEMARSEERMKAHKFSVGILGEFKRGKSTVINALLGREIMPSDILPTSATMNRVTYGMEPKARILMRDGSEETIEVDELVDYVTKLDDEKASRAEKVEEAIVSYPCKFCQNGVDIVDTPGLNDEGRMDKIVEEVIPKLDAVIMVLVPDSPFSMSEAEFVRTKLLTSDISRLIFLVNKFDTVRKKDRDRVLSEIRKRIETSVMEKMKEIYGENSEEYLNVKIKLADIRIFPISARDALDGRLAHDEELLRDSGMLEFEEALSKMLTEERGALELGVPVAQALRGCNKILAMIENGQNALRSSQEQFKETQRKTLAESSAMREQQSNKIRELNEKAKRVKREMTDKAAECYDEIEKKAHQIINELTLEDPKRALTDEMKKALIENTAKKIGEMSDHEISIFSERIINELNGILGKEAVQTAQLLTQFEAKLEEACKIQKEGVMPTLGAFAVDTAAFFLTSDILPGLGGAIAGYRAAGVKGALLGGGTAFVSGMALLVLLGTAGVSFIPAGLLACAASSLSGKKVCEMVFAGSRNKKALEEIKKTLQEGFDESSAQMRRDRLLEKWIDSTVEGQFNILIEAMNKECQRIVAQANETINNIKMELVRDAEEKKKRMEEYNRMRTTVMEIQSRLVPLRERIASCIHDEAGILQHTEEQAGEGHESEQ